MIKGVLVHNQTHCGGDTLMDRKRSRDQIHEVILWLQQGKMPGYSLRNARASRRTSEVIISFDCFATAAGVSGTPAHLLASRILDTLLDPDVTDFHILAFLTVP